MELRKVRFNLSAIKNGDFYSKKKLYRESIDRFRNNLFFAGQLKQ
jgi:hypothetical protein